MLAGDELDGSILAMIGGTIAWFFTPLGFGNWQAAVATVLGLVAKEGVVSTMGVLYGMNDGGYSVLASAMTVGAAYAFMSFNLLCAPCFAAIGAIHQEMNSPKWFWFAIGYQTVFAYGVSLCIYQFWLFLSGGSFGIGTIAAILVVVGVAYLLFRPDSNQKKKTRLGAAGKLPVNSR
jgi:ferrous iron transport protein B